MSLQRSPLLGLRHIQWVEHHLAPFYLPGCKTPSIVDWPTTGVWFFWLELACIEVNLRRSFALQLPPKTTLQVENVVLHSISEVGIVVVNEEATPWALVALLYIVIFAVFIHAFRDGFLTSLAPFESYGSRWGDVARICFQCNWRRRRSWWSPQITTACKNSQCRHYLLASDPHPKIQYTSDLISRGIIIPSPTVNACKNNGYLYHFSHPSTAPFLPVSFHSKRRERCSSWPHFAK